VIAHRLSTIKNADIIAVVSEGTIVEQGSHQELLEKQGRYFDLVEAQSLHSNEDETKNCKELDSLMHEDDQVTRVEEDEGVRSIIHFHNIVFSYPTRPNQIVLSNFNLSVRDGESIALVGPSGCGKSTVMQLVECFYHPDQGSVKFDGIDMRELNIRWLRDQIGLVSQEPLLFDTTIADNIRFGMMAASQHEIEEAAKLANAHDFIMSFPDGYKTQIGQGSSQVSGGQKQRIAIARALLKKPKVLLLDEATSALDSESESIVQASIDSLISTRRQTCK
jgi:ATP-binding cassette, subfamily B (MDR/TAP), member 1